jgi:micrococcal nuclease
MAAMRLALLLTIAAVAAACAGSQRPRAGPASVAHVVDGDTIDVRVGGRVERVRLLGIDTPESVKPRTPVQCYAREASARTKALLPVGTLVRLVRDAEARDAYGRLLAYVYRAGDGLFVNLTLAREGYAGPLPFRPNLAHAAELAEAADAAHAAGRGLWGRCGGPHEPLPSHG